MPLEASPSQSWFLEAYNLTTTRKDNRRGKITKFKNKKAKKYDVNIKGKVF